jgi:hypothetical protein
MLRHQKRFRMVWLLPILIFAERLGPGGAGVCPLSPKPSHPAGEGGRSPNLVSALRLGFYRRNTRLPAHANYTAIARFTDVARGAIAGATKSNVAVRCPFRPSPSHEKINEI